MQILLRQTEPLTFCPRPVWSLSCWKFGGPWHWSSRVFRNIQIITEKLAIAVKLARTADSKCWKALVLLIGAELAGWTFVRN